ncbi:hypothetical protein CVT26_008132 [Gymnopilus dilepis]|uniref:SET domain-containing protein n=1 Tax=Gymnopilus dilepis TaxID=231916 RepID=A0A409YJV9_9AGAR|nr:hypothetical protein CVT26_008132 [Gymnopilus dilepis]
METCTLDGRVYRLHAISLPPSDGEQATISCLLNPDLIPLLPNPLPPTCPPPSTSTSNRASPPNFSILQTAHKGAGIFAARPIEAGELIMREHPALILPTGKFPKEVYDALADRLPEKRRKELLAMANARSKEECESEVEGIVRTNALMLELDVKGVIPEDRREVYGGVYPFVNRANHSCGPNAAIKWDLASLTISLYALRDIAEGEEICKTYVNPALPRATRMSILQKNYRFRCDCPWCNIRRVPCPNPDQGSESAGTEEDFTPSELAQIASSDADRAALGSWIYTHPGYTKWWSDIARPDSLVISSHLSALSLIEKEGLHGLQNLFVEEIAMCYAMLGSLEGFREWGTRVVKLCKVEDPDMARRFEEWLEDPERRVKRWGWRKKQREQQSGKKRTASADDDEAMEGVGSFLFPDEDSD